jgi:hypothetical protein
VDDDRAPRRAGPAGAGSDGRVRVALVVALVLVVQPGAVTSVSLLAAAALTALLAASFRWRIDAPVLAALLLTGVALRLAIGDRIGSDVLDVVAAAVRRTLAGGNPYGVGYDVSRPPGAPYVYGPLALLWYLPFSGFPRLAELAAGTAILGALAVRRRFLGLAIYAAAPVLVDVTMDGANDTSAGLLILLSLGVAARRPVPGAVLLALAAAFKPYALAWAPPLLWWAGLPALVAFAVASLVAWSPVLFVWGPSSLLRSLQLGGAIHQAPYLSFGAVWEGLTGRPAPAEALERAKLALGGLTATAGLRLASSMDAVILAGTATFLVTLYAGYWATFAYLAAIAPILCWRVDDWVLPATGARSGPWGPRRLLRWVMGPSGRRRAMPLRAGSREAPSRPGTASGYARTSTNPAAAKSPSKARASLMRSRRITSKLVASTNE